MSSVIDLIMQDHREVERLFGLLAEHPDQRPLATAQLVSLLVAHSRAEEGEVYPVAAAEQAISDTVAHGQHEHVEAEQMLERLSEADPTTKEYEELLSKLTEAVTHHVEEEETDVLPKMREAMPSERLDELGRAFVASRNAHLGPKAGSATATEVDQQARNANLSGRSSMSKEQKLHAMEEEA